jgi:hypothetical protein
MSAMPITRKTLRGSMTILARLDPLLKGLRRGGMK